jgi:hypothetical protein
VILRSGDGSCWFLLDSDCVLPASTDDSVLKTSRYVNSGCNSNGECKPDSPRMLCHQVMGCVEKDNSSTAPDWPKPVEQ